MVRILNTYFRTIIGYKTLLNLNMEGHVPSTSATLTPSNVRSLSTSMPAGTSSFLDLPIDVVETIIPLLTNTEDFNNFIDAIHSDSRSYIYDDIITREYKNRLKRRNADLIRTKITLEKVRKLATLKNQKAILENMKILNKQRRRIKRRLQNNQ